LDRNSLFGLALIGWFVALAICEALWAPRSAERSGDGRLVTNFAFMALALLISSLLPVSIAVASMSGGPLKIGIGNHVALPWLASFALTILFMTFASYWAHRLMHATPALWRIHRVHHADSSVDVSTSLRNHPLELFITLPASALAVLIVAPAVSVVVVSQTVMVAAAIWDHADFPLPRWIERPLSLIIFTPRLHRVHHSPERKLHDTNFGEILVLWDWLFGTLTLNEERGRVGLDNQVSHPDRLVDQLISPIHPA
jgi:sterol desaturase/sphingolipid hydroxylase (fatty acid hydroxylase superfamily)